MSRVFRIRYGWKKGGASSSETVYREGFEAMIEELEGLLLQLDVYQAVESRERRRGLAGRRLALRVFSPRGRDEKPAAWYVTKIHSVEEFIDGQWSTLEFEWVQPILAVKGP